jgi:cell division protein FtsN
VEKKVQPLTPVKQPQKQVVAKSGEKKPGHAENKQASVGQKKAVSAPSTQKKEAVAKKPATKPKNKTVTGPGEASRGPWTVIVGNYLLEDALAADMVRVRKAGLEAAVQPGSKRKAPMNRLLVAEYDNRGVARAELDKLKRYTSDAFIIEHGGKFAVYAGSYLLDARAKSEKERLAAAGFTLTLKRVEVGIPTKRLSAGTFSDKKSADAVLKKLKAAGLKASLTRQ